MPLSFWSCERTTHIMEKVKTHYMVIFAKANDDIYLSV